MKNNYFFIKIYFWIFINSIFLILFYKKINYKKIIKMYTPDVSYQLKNKLTPLKIRFMVSKLLKIFKVNKNLCYIENILIYSLMKKYYDSNVKICFGVKKENKNIEGHCWLELKNKIFFEDDYNFKKMVVI